MLVIIINNITYFKFTALLQFKRIISFYFPIITRILTFKFLCSGLYKLPLRDTNFIFYGHYKLCFEIQKMMDFSHIIVFFSLCNLFIL